MGLLAQILKNAEIARKKHVPVPYVRQPHKPYSRPKNKDYSKQAKGFVEVAVHAGHPNRVFMDPKVRTDEDQIFFTKEKIKSLKEGIMRQQRNAAGRGLTIEGGIRDLKNKLRKLRNGKRRK